MANHSTVVTHTRMKNGHTEIAHKPIGGPLFEQLAKTLPAVVKGVMFEEMIFGAIADYLKLGTQTICGTLLFCAATALQDALDIAIKVESPLVEIAGGDGDEAEAMGDHDVSAGMRIADTVLRWTQTGTKKGTEEKSRV